MGDVVIDTSGDLDVAAAAGAKFTEGSYIVTTVFRLGGVDTDDGRALPLRRAGSVRQARPPGQAHDRRLLGPLVAEDAAAGRGLVQLPAYDRLDALKVEDQTTRATSRAASGSMRLVEFIRANMPGFENCYVIDVAPQLGVRQTRLLGGRICRDQGRRRTTACTSTTRWRAAATITRPIAPCCRGRSKVCSSPAATIRRPKRRRSCRAKSRPACRWASRPASPPRWRCRRTSRSGEVDPKAICAQGPRPGRRPRRSCLPPMPG